jgi:hypothetical protein
MMVEKQEPVVDVVAGSVTQFDVDGTRIVGESLTGYGVDTQGQGLPLTQHTATQNTHTIDIS